MLDLFEFRDGKVIARWGLMDMAALMAQIGAEGAPSTTDRLPRGFLASRCPSAGRGTAGGFRIGTSDFLNRATDALGDVQESPLLDNADAIAEDEADDGGADGAIAGRADDVIDQIQGTEDRGTTAA